MQRVTHAGYDEAQGGSDIPLRAQYARLLIKCVECRKPRIIYSKAKLTKGHKVHLCKYHPIVL